MTVGTFGSSTKLSPVLVGDEVAAVLDLKTDRVARRLLIQQWTWVAQGARRESKRRIEEALHRFERFQLDEGATPKDRPSDR